MLDGPTNVEKTFVARLEDRNALTARNGCLAWGTKIHARLQAKLARLAMQGGSAFLHIAKVSSRPRKTLATLMNACF